MPWSIDLVGAHHVIYEDATLAIGPGITTELHPVLGVTLAVASAGIKTPGRIDLALLELAPGSTVAAVWTQNRFCAAPIDVARTHLKTLVTGPRWLLINTGNANAGTGSQGLADAQQCCAELATQMNAPSASVLPFSTGVIGEFLPMPRISAALPELRKNLGQAQWLDLAQAIMTTDTRPKAHSLQLQFDGTPVTITGIAKGSGMICPNMATMLGFVTTDAAIASADLQALLVALNERTFNRITVDGDTSTNDACILAATGASGVSLSPASSHWSAFCAALHEVMTELALQIVRDGEGATRMVAITVLEAASSEDALAVAYSVAHSPLFKTALSAGDANWGRILAAIGRAPIAELDLAKVTLWLEDVPLVQNGARHPDYEEALGAAIFQRDAFSIRIQLGAGECSETVWTTDLSHEYISINADYRS